ncbi:hypothetical protein DL98DRAFT_300961 [Cadophora sp. DSE1049]|nr:hypothetical protein DL98DRAFT_300961 [Cadophora sp. DSE1049]
MTAKPMPVDEAEAIRQDLENNHNSNSNFNSNLNTAPPLSPALLDQAPPPYNLIPRLPSLHQQSTNLKMADDHNPNPVGSANSNGEGSGSGAQFQPEPAAAAAAITTAALLAGRLIEAQDRRFHNWVIVLMVLFAIAALCLFARWTWLGSRDQTSI